MPFAVVRMSGFTPQWSTANHFPVLPHPVMSHQQPAARPLFHRVQRVAQHGLIRVVQGKRDVAPQEPIQHLGDGFGGAQGPAEGPLWWQEGGYLLFSDIHNNKRMKYQPGTGVSLFLEPTNRANGLTRLASNDTDFDRVPGLTRYSPV